MFIVTEYAALSIRHAHGDLCKHLGIDSSAWMIGTRIYS